MRKGRGETKPPPRSLWGRTARAPGGEDATRRDLSSAPGRPGDPQPGAAADAVAVLPDRTLEDGPALGHERGHLPALLVPQALVAAQVPGRRRHPHPAGDLRRVLRLFALR